MKRLLSILLSVAMVLGMMVIPVAAASAPTVTVETAAAEAKPGDTVTLAVTIADNPGFTNFEWHINYDESRLEVKSIETSRTIIFDGEELTSSYIPDASVVTNPDYAKGEAYITCAKDTAFTKASGTLFKLVFEVKADATSGHASVSIGCDKFADESVNPLKAITATYVAGGVTINAPHTCEFGDWQKNEEKHWKECSCELKAEEAAHIYADDADTTCDICGYTRTVETGDPTTGGSTTGGSTTGGSTTGGSTTGGSTTGGSTTGGSTTGGSTTGGSTTGGSTTGGSTTGGSTTGGSTTGGSTTGGSTTGGETTGGTETTETDVVIESFTDATIPESILDEIASAEGATLVEKLENFLESAAIAEFVKNNPTVNADAIESVLYDIVFMYKDDNGVWQEADEEHFPVDGKLEIVVEVPNGTNHANFTYFAAHMFTKDAFGKVAGDIEYPAVTEIVGADGKEYIKFYVTGLSPITIGYVETTVNDYTVTLNPNGGTGSIITASVAAGTEYTLPENTFIAPSGKEFKCWNVNGTEMLPGSKVLVNSNLFINAVWVDADTGFDWYWLLSMLQNLKFKIVATADANGMISNPGIKEVKHGLSVTYTITPNKGYEIDKVIVDGKDVGAVSSYTFKNVIANHTISASFKLKTIDNPYTDVTSDDWFYEDVLFVTAFELMNGTGEGLFSPDATLNRAMLATVLWRMEESPVVESTVKFNDVPAGEWYSDAIAWAAANGIVNGYGEGVFAPEDALTREQAVAMLNRYADYKELKNEDAKATEASYTCSDWAESNVDWADENGLLSDLGVDVSDMTKDATRAELAAYLFRFYKAFLLK